MYRADIATLKLIELFPGRCPGPFQQGSLFQRSLMDPALTDNPGRSPSGSVQTPEADLKGFPLVVHGHQGHPVELASLA